jgi:REP element-mobilizing transposase RayT
MGRLALETETIIYAWALLTNHAHILLRSSPYGLSRFMRRLLTGYAVSYNLRHQRQGHLFQNRYKSIVCEEEAYFLELVRYIHLNPLRAGLVDTLDQLATHPWCGHAVLLGTVAYQWQDRDDLLARFGQSQKAGIAAYCQFVADGVKQGARPELVGGLARSQATLRCHQEEPGTVDCRVLGCREFVEQTLQWADGRDGDFCSPGERLLRGQEYLRQACSGAGGSPQELLSGSRRGRVSALRSAIAQELVSNYGWTLAETARQLGVSTSAIAKILGRAGNKSG